MFVKNVNGSSRFGAPEGYSSWLHYWEESKVKLQAGKFYLCPACNSSLERTEFVGAHVQKAEGFDKSWYIAPLCKACNQRTDSFNVTVTLIPVPSNR